jgi:hypothetical protein
MLEIAEAALLLDEAVTAHLAGKQHLAASAIENANMPAVRAWTEATWDRHNQAILRFVNVADTPPEVPKAQLKFPRIPSAEMNKALAARDGSYCRLQAIHNPSGSVKVTLRKLRP